jgi:ribosome-associated protein
VVTDPGDPAMATDADAVAIPPTALPESRAMAVLAARTASERQGRAVVILDVRELITITDYFVICSGSSDRQVKTLSDDIVRALKERGVRPVRREGEVGGRWILLDFVDFVVHVFHDEERAFYRLENLWRDAPTVGWENEEASEPR